MALGAKIEFCMRGKRSAKGSLGLPILNMMGKAVEPSRETHDGVT